jgi:hypothetical protein
MNENDAWCASVIFISFMVFLTLAAKYLSSVLVAMFQPPLCPRCKGPLDPTEELEEDWGPEDGE